MNRTYRSTRSNTARTFALKGLAASLMIAFGSSTYALPTGGAVSAGGATIASGAGTTTITQSSQNVAINWQSFSIGATEAVNFVQPSSSSVALNRVLGSDPSNILGSLSANGKVFLVNPNGILFAQGAQVNVGGLVASTRGITDSDFMAGNYKFTGSSSGTVVNRGSINADGGYVALLGASVSNEGVISARLGTVALAAGNAMTLDVAGDGLLSVAVNQGAVDALVQNGGMIRADGGQVLLTALSAGNLLQSAVNNTGVIQAQTVENRNGTIRLMGDMQSGTVSVGGTLDVSGTGTGQTGGNIVVAGNHVGLFDGYINASGDAGGGTVLVGGGYQGNNPAVQNASATYMSPASTINVDAITNGNGGTAVLWANNYTRAEGNITARGGTQGGNGGLVETSAHQLDVAGIRVNTSAPNGANGLWLLDPADVTIGVVTARGQFNANNFEPNPGENTATVAVADIIFALGLGNVTITTTNSGGVPGTPTSLSGLGDITVGAAIAWGGATTLTLSAAGDVNINAALTAVPGNLVVCCGQDINVRAAISTTNGSVWLSAGRDISLVRSAGLFSGTDITAVDGNITMCAGRNIILDNQLNGAPLMTVTNGSVTAGQDLGLARGLVLSAGNGGTGPGPAGGTVIFTDPAGPLNTHATVTTAPTFIVYNPVSYAVADRTDYTTNIIGTAPVQFMLVFPDGADKIFDNTRTATFTGLKGNPAGVTLVQGGLSTADFDTAAIGQNKIITYSGFTLGGVDANLFALPGTPVTPGTVICCAAGQRTTGNITAATTTTGGTTSSTPLPPILPVFYPYTLLAGLNLDIGGITMPPVFVAEVAPVEEAPQLSGFVDTPIVVPPPPPALPPRPDRN